MVETAFLSFIIDGHEFSVSDGSNAYLVGHDGWGASPVSRLSSQGPLQHGDTEEGFRLRPRLASLVFQVPNNDLDELYMARRKLLDLIGPEGSFKLRWYLSYGTREFDVVLYDDMKLDWRPSKWANLRFPVVLKAGDPTCYDPAVKTLTVTGSEGQSFQVPMTVPTFVGGSGINGVFTVSYPGNWHTYPLITIEGPLVGVTITNLATSEVLSFPTLTLGVGARRIIDTRYGFKTVVDETGQNKINELESSSDLATFHLVRKRAYENFRSNDMEISAGSVESSTRVLFKWNDRYIGI